MPFSTWLLYAAAVLVLTMTPGPSVLMCVTQSVCHGARRALFSALGSVTAVAGIMACSFVGLGAVIAASGPWFALIKWFGVAYLLYVGISTFRSTQSSFEVDADTGQSTVASRRGLVLKGLLVGISNPKALLFFTAFFPQFIDPAAPQGLQFLILGGTFVAFELFWLMFYASFAARLAPWLRAPGRARWFNRLAGGTFMGAGVLLATVKQGHE